MSKKKDRRRRPATAVEARGKGTPEGHPHPRVPKRRRAGADGAVDAAVTPGRARAVSDSNSDELARLREQFATYTERLRRVVATLTEQRSRADERLKAEFVATIPGRLYYAASEAGLGAAEVDLETLSALADVLGVRFEWLAMGTPPVWPEPPSPPPRRAPHVGGAARARVIDLLEWRHGRKGPVGAQARRGGVIRRVK